MITIVGGRYHRRHQLPATMRNIVVLALTFITSVMVTPLPPGQADRVALLSLMAHYVIDFETLQEEADAALKAQMN